MLDPNIISSPNSIKSLIKLNANFISILNNLLMFKEETSELIESFDFTNDINTKDLTSLLFYFGFLTIKDIEDDKYIFKIPNLVMKEVFIKEFKTFASNMIANEDSDVFESAIDEVAISGNIEPLLKETTKILESNGSRMFMNFSEKYIQVLLYTLLYQNNKYNLYSEYNVSGGYCDLMIIHKEKKSNFDILIELKYIKKSDYSDLVLEEKKQAAIEQIKRYESDDRLDKSKLRKFVIIFIGYDYKLYEIQ